MRKKSTATINISLPLEQNPIDSLDTMDSSRDFSKKKKLSGKGAKTTRRDSRCWSNSRFPAERDKTGKRLPLMNNFLGILNLSGTLNNTTVQFGGAVRSRKTSILRICGSRLVTCAMPN
jgi:hypothetical protein